MAPRPRRTRPLALIGVLSLSVALGLTGCQKEEKKPGGEKPTATISAEPGGGSQTPQSPSGGTGGVTATPDATSSEPSGGTQAPSTPPPSTSPGIPTQSPMEDQHLGNGPQAPEEQAPDPVIDKFAKAYANTAQGRTVWLKGLRPLVTDDLYQGFEDTDFEVVQKGSKVKSSSKIGGVQAGAYPFRVTYEGPEAAGLDGFTAEQPDGSVKIDKVYPEGSINTGN